MWYFPALLWVQRRPTRPLPRWLSLLHSGALFLRSGAVAPAVQRRPLRLCGGADAEGPRRAHHLGGALPLNGLNPL